MAELVAAAATSHSVLLAAGPEHWAERADRNRANTDLHDSEGIIRTYDEHVERAAGRYDAEITPERWATNWERCTNAIAKLKDEITKARPNVLVVIGDDQRELFTSANQPALAVGTGASFGTERLDRKVDVVGSAFFSAVARDYLMDERHELPGDRDLALEFVHGLIAAGFDVASCETTSAESGLGHAFGFPVARLADKPIKLVPIFINTYYPPNQPTPRRCFALGQTLRTLIDTAPTRYRVALVASGGLSHFVIDETIDHEVLAAIGSRDADYLKNIPVQLLESGSSEIRNWIVAAGVMEHHEVAWHDYVPCYRSPAGTGCTMGFLSWHVDGARPE